MSYGKQQTLDRPAHQTSQQSSSALAKAETTELVGSYRDPATLNAALQKVSERCHLLTPATTVGTIPEGCEVLLTAVTVDVEHETYKPRKGSDDLALKGVALNRIAAAYGVSWIPSQCFRDDDGSSPYYVHYKCAGIYKAFDGQPMVITGEKVVDLRGTHEKGLAPQAEGMSEKELSQARSHILSLAESKAKNRATRSIGIRASYTKAELAKPFVCARVMFTGRTDDPTLKPLFAAEIARKFDGGTSSLYGAPQQLPAPASAVSGKAPPPIGSVPRDDDDGAIPTQGESVPQATPAPAAPKASGFTVNVQGVETPIEKAPVEALQKAIAQCSADLADGVVPPDELASAREWRKAAMAQVEARGQY